MYLIDAYNLFHVLARGRPTREERGRLIGLIGDHFRKGGYRAILVFDPTPDIPRRRTLGQVEIRTVAEGRKADDEILKILASTRDRTAYTLVTDDRGISQEAERRGMRVIPCREFAGLLEGCGPGTPPADRDVSPEEVDYWMGEFGLRDGPERS